MSRPAFLWQRQISVVLPPYQGQVVTLGVPYRGFVCGGRLTSSVTSDAAFSAQLYSREPSLAFDSETSSVSISGDSAEEIELFAVGLDDLTVMGGVLDFGRDNGTYRPVKWAYVNDEGSVAQHVGKLYLLLQNLLGVEQTVVGMISGTGAHV